MQAIKTPITIGEVVLSYDVDGQPINAVFNPAIRVTDTSVKFDRLTKATSASEVKDQAQTILSDWFTHVEAFELTDREEGFIDSEMVECLKWDNDLPKKCTIRFIFRYREVK